MADYDIFREQLGIRYPAHGHALWDPRPNSPDRPVEIGDVGFIRMGKFHRLFNALLPAHDASQNFGVPGHYEQLRVAPKLENHHITYSTLSGNHYCSTGVDVAAELDCHETSPGEREVSFTYSERRGGAVLSLPVTARRTDTLAKRDFSEWILKHIDRCFAFVQELGLGIEQMEDIVLVTGYDRTRSWTNVAFLGDHRGARVSFRVKVVNALDSSIRIQFSHGYAKGALLNHGPEGKDLPEDQCVFIRGLRVTRTFKFLPKRLIGAAGPSTEPGGYDSEPDTEIMSIPATTKYRDPLHIILDYVAEVSTLAIQRAYDCDMILVHDDDLEGIDGIGEGTPLESLRPEVLMDLLRKSNVEISKVHCAVSTQKDSSPVSDRLNTDNSAVGVAMLSTLFQNWNAALPSQQLSNATQNPLTVTRGPRPSPVRTHPRSSSGSSPEMVVDLQLLQKDPVQSKIDEATGTSHTHESNPRMSASFTGSSVHVQTREQVTGAQPHVAKPPRGDGPKVGFTIAASMAGSDNEWLSNESGPAIPPDESSGDEGSGTKTPQELSPASLVGQQVHDRSVTLVSGPSPRAVPAPPRPRVQIHGFTPTSTRPSRGVAPAAWVSPPLAPEPSHYPQRQREFCCQQPQQPYQQVPDSVQDVQQQSPPRFSRQPPTPSHTPDHIFPPKLSPRTPDTVPIVSGALTVSPTPTSTRSEQYPTHRRSRASSTRSSIADHTLRPHPLIRSQSFGHGDLAPLEVSSDVAQVQLSSSLPVGHAASASLTNIRTVYTPSPDKRFSSTIAGHPPTSSTHSLSTPPIQSDAAVERGRTTSMACTASTSLPTRGSVATPQNAPLKPCSHLETVHALLPSLYVTQHFTILQWRSPVCESYDRVARARRAAR